MEYNQEQIGEITIITPTSDRLDAAQAVRFKEDLKKVVDDGADHLILDLSHISFLDSSGLGALVAHLKHMGPERTFSLCGLTGAVEKVFKLTRMDTVFSIYADRKLALAADQAQAS